jgi:NAD-reducing hydrogenase large subunit
MSKQRSIVLDPVTRIEGHAKITIHLDASGEVSDARFHVTEFRGFEKFCEGRTFWEMPGITARICGICPVSHLTASAKAGDEILGLRPPPTARKLRRIMNWAQIVQSHALSFFHLSGPDLFLGMESDPADRNLMGLAERMPDLTRDGIRLRGFGQKVIRILGGQSVHPAWTVPGGVREPLSISSRDEILSMLPEAFQIIDRTIALYKRDVAEPYGQEAQVYGRFPSLFLGLVTPEGGLEHYDGVLRIIDSNGFVLEEGLSTDRFRDVIAEAVEPWSFLKFPYYRPFGYEQYAGMYRVGPLARLNICKTAGTPKADSELREFRSLAPRGKPVTGSFFYHYARLIEILFCLERIEETLHHPHIHDTLVRREAGVNRFRGVGVSEAPRGTLFHEYEVDQDGILQKVNLIIATGQNNIAMNRTILQIAQAYLSGDKLGPGILNRIEHGIRVYDPCLSCSTHAVGQMPMRVQLVGPDGGLVDEIVRD